MKIAFLCLAHNNFEYLKVLKDYCVSDGDSFFLHVDNKVDYEDENFKSSDCYCISDSERLRTRWGTFSIVDATLKLMALANSTGTYDYYFLISGHDLPLKSKFELKNSLKHHRALMSLWSSCEYNRPDSAYLYKNNDITEKINSKRIYREFFHYTNYEHRLLNIGELQNERSKTKLRFALLFKKILNSFRVKSSFNFDKYYKGSQWWVLNKEMLNYCLSFKDKKQFFYMHAPDEKYFHTILMNSIYSREIIISNGERYLEGSHYIRWKKEGMEKISKKNLTIATNSNAFFTRKIDFEDFDYFVKHIESLIKDKARNEF
ncbi:hypothetical protein VHA01S_032_00300 [Vibrio halioticoli NBRC 102217]|uniref:Peptide O-xylosyltransferase n=1 Tax=Vibrio halioticoli NBRC 102217 TaxID=1219072 RepID=V5HLK9_9VIBR|nr:beta-1,6-N-acetylglucosaminyltransferase [Vibrio halioticoli]GAD90080.1 hypothetical protein VHA01S_032_00300 [Vibrio halioticoli NBRC 102217]